MVREHRTDSDFHIEEIYRFEGWRHDAVSGETIEAVLPMMKTVRLNRKTQARWTLTEPDGHTLATYSPSGAELTFEVAGAYGRPLPDVLKLPYNTGDFASAATWPIESVHGLEQDRHLGLVHAGARHFFARDGMWMQPEPLLHLGLWNADPAQPVALGGVYAGGDPVGMADRDGYFVQVLAPAAGAALVATATVAAVAYYANDGPAKTSALVTSAAGALASAWQGDKQAEAAQDPGAPAAEGGEGASQGGEVQDIDGVTPDFTGEPGTTVRGKKQSRTYAEDGYPQTDRDLPHKGERGKGDTDKQGSEDHSHDWGRPEGGGKPTRGDRGPSRPPREGDPPPPRGFGE